jgi:hypothetical protein
MAKASFTRVGNSADSPEPLRRPLLTTGDDAKILGIYDPHLGYGAEDFPCQRPQRKMRPPSRAPFGVQRDPVETTQSECRRSVRIRMEESP